MGVPLNLGYDSKHRQFDYGARTDDSPIYIGYTAAADASDAASIWTIEKYTLVDSPVTRVTRIQTVYKKDWTNRANYF